MQVHVAVMENGFLLSTIEPTDHEEPEFDRAPEERALPSSMRPKAAKIRSSVIKDETTVVSTLKHLLVTARNKYDSDAAPLMALQGSLRDVSDGAAAVFHYELVDRGLVVRYEYLGDAPVPVVLEHEGVGGRVDVSLYGQPSKATSAYWVFGASDEATEWTRSMLERLREERAQAEAEGEEDEEEAA